MFMPLDMMLWIIKLLHQSASPNVHDAAAIIALAIKKAGSARRSP